MIPDRRDFFEASRDEKEPERDSRSGSHVTTDRTNSKFLPKRTEISLVQSSQTNFWTSSLRFLQSTSFKNVCSWKNEVVTFMNFTLTVKSGTHDVVSFFQVMNLCSAILCSELSWEFLSFWKFEKIFCTNSRRERAYRWEWLRKISQRVANWEGKIRVNGVLTR